MNNREIGICMFKMAPQKAKEEKDTFGFALVLYTILFTDRGREVFRASMKQFSIALIKKLNKLQDELSQSSEFKMELTREESVRVQSETEEGQSNIPKREASAELQRIIQVIKKLKEQVEEITDAEFENIKANIDKEYFVGNMITMEGFILGLYDWMRRNLNPIYELIDLQQKMIFEKMIQKEIYDVIEKLDSTALIDKTIVGKIFGEKASRERCFEPIDPSMEKKNVAQRIIINKRCLIPYCNYQDRDFLLRVVGGIGYENKSPKEQKRITKDLETLEAKINNLLRSKDLFAMEKKEEYDEEIFGIIELIILGLMDLRKKIFSKDLRKAIKAADGESEDYDWWGQDCDAFAIALHRKFQWPLAIIRGMEIDPSKGTKRFEDCHAVAIPSNGYIADAEGIRPFNPDEMKQRCLCFNIKPENYFVYPLATEKEMETWFSHIPVKEEAIAAGMVYIEKNPQLFRGESEKEIRYKIM